MKKNISFQMLWLSQSLSNLGDSLYILSIVTVIYKITGSAFISGLFPLLRVIAQAISTILVPLVMDRMKLLHLIWISQVGQTLLFAVMALLDLDGHSTWLTMTLLFLVFWISVIHGCALPARNALTPRLVSADYLMKANSLLTTSDQFVLLVGWSLGGVLVYHLGTTSVMLITTGLMVLSTLCLLFVTDSSNEESLSTKNSGKWKQIIDGWQYIWKDLDLRIISFMELVSNFGGAIWTGSILLVFVKEALNKGEIWWGFINSGYFVGTILGGLIVWSLSRIIEERVKQSILWGCAILSAATFCFAINSNPWLALFLSFAMGLPNQLRSIAQRTFIQAQTREDMLPKVFAAVTTIMFVTFGFSVLIMGAIADFLGVRTVYMITALLFTLTTVLSLFIKTRRLNATKEEHVQSKIMTK
ncbi:putative MFS family arabinose efflux permease [Laceyella sacchari]|uniref:MFS transporter n=1 Tax=Laceyella sacchari TaxID=37482 RepID=UPI0010487883|nr:MFS transporter [Laceyella sacchari]TCW41581.1 putative MFS family arabinose efflux permease [Laceyella sacchari]